MSAYELARNTDQDWDTFEGQVAAHKIAVARLTRIEDQLIAIVRENHRPLAADLAARYAAAIDEARRAVRDTSLALFPPGDSQHSTVAALAPAAAR